MRGRPGRCPEAGPAGSPGTSAGRKALLGLRVPCRGPNPFHRPEEAGSASPGHVVLPLRAIAPGGHDPSASLRAPRAPSGPPVLLQALPFPKRPSPKVTRRFGVALPSRETNRRSPTGLGGPRVRRRLLCHLRQARGSPSLPRLGIIPDCPSAFLDAAGSPRGRGSKKGQAVDSRPVRPGSTVLSVFTGNRLFLDLLSCPCSDFPPPLKMEPFSRWFMVNLKCLLDDKVHLSAIFF